MRGRNRAAALAVLLVVIAITPGLGHGTHGAHFGDDAPPRVTASATPTPPTTPPPATRAPTEPAATPLARPDRQPPRKSAAPVPATAAASPAPPAAPPASSPDSAPPRSGRPSSTPARARPASLPIIAEKGVEPGGVATTLVAFPGLAGVDSVAYVIDAAPGVRIFGPTRGRVAVQDGRVSVPITFGVPPRAPAGWFSAGTVRLVGPGVDGEPRAFGTTIQARHALEFRLGRTTVTVPTGHPASLPYRLENRGNAGDSVTILVTPPPGWTVAVPAPTVWVGAGESTEGAIQLAAPTRARLGSAGPINLTARSDATRVTRTARLMVVDEEGPVAGFISVPGALFLGSTSGDGAAPMAALTAAGEAFPGVQVDLAVRSLDRLAPPPAFREALGGPRLRLGIRTRHVEAALGDVYTGNDLFTGPVLMGRGVDLGWRGAGREASLLIARPSSYGYSTEDGRIIRLGGRLPLGRGALTLQLSDVERRSSTWAPYDARGAGAGYQIHAGSHRLDVTAGVMSVSADSFGSRTGPSLEAGYTYSGDRGRVTARLRRVPATVQRTASLGNQAFVSTSYQLRPTIAWTGWGYSQSSPRLDADESRAWGGATGLALRLPGHGQLQLLGTYRTSQSSRPGTVASVTRTVRTGIDLPLARSLSAEVHADVGTITQDGRHPFRMARGGFRWNTSGRWAWIGAMYQDYGIGDPTTTLEGNATLRFGATRAFGGVTARLDAPSIEEAITLWSGSNVPLNELTELNLGVDYQPFGLYSRFQISLGVSRRFRLPLPMPRPTTVEGIVFQDLNGNRVHDDGEPPAADLPVTFGPLRTTTDAEGRFRFYDRVDGSVRVDIGALPPGVVVPADLFIPSTGFVEIPLIRTARLDLQLFLDRDGDGEWDAGEAAAAQAVVSLVDPRGRTRDAATDDEGRVSFGGVEPGPHTLQVFIMEAGRRAARPFEVTLEVRGGEDVTQRIAVPAHQREIRIRGGSSMPGIGTGHDDAGRPDAG